MENNNRKFVRVNFAAECRLLTENQKIPLRVLNISLKGLLAEFDGGLNRKDLENGTIEIKLSASDIVLSFKSVLAHFQENQAGYRFVETDTESLSHLRRLLEINTGDASRIESELPFLLD